MKIKRFLANDMRSALAQVKEELGPDAVIMSNKKVANGVEIVAAYEESDVPVSKQEMSAKSPTTSRGFDDYDEENVTISPQAVAAAKVSSNEPRMPRLDKKSRTAKNNEQMANTLSELLARQKSGANTKSTTREPLNSSLSSGPKTLAEQQNDFVPSKRSTERAPKVATDPSITAMQEEIASIRKLLQHQLAGLMTGELERSEPVKAMLLKLLVRGGFAEDYAKTLVDEVQSTKNLRQAWKDLAEVLKRNLLIGNDEILQMGGAVTLVGPTGVGKTTTIAKLAAHFAMKYGPDQVALITADHYRIGAYEQLQTYGRIMGCTVKSMTDMSEMQNTLYQLRNRRLVLIDTAGMGQRDDRLKEQLDQLVNSCNIHIHNYLVLPATGQRRVLQEAYDQFSQIELSGAIITKLDESIGLGDVLGVCMQNELPISYTANGQRVPEDLDVANGSMLVQLALAYMEDDK